MPKKKTAGQSDVKTALPAKKAPRTTKSSSSTKAILSIDYPLEGEIVTSPVYTVRVTAQDPQGVEVSFDGKTWRPARESVGHWWYDWTGYQSGVYTLNVRMTTAAGRSHKAKPRQFTVIA